MKKYTHDINNSDNGGTISSIEWYPFNNGAFIRSNYKGNLDIFDTEMFQIVANFKFSNHKILDMKIRSTHLSHPLIAIALDNSNIHLCDPMSGDTTHTLYGHHQG